MAVPITVTTSPGLISRTAAKPYLINNDGTNNIYLGQDTAVNSNNYAFILQPGQSLSWSEINREVWAVTATATSKVSIAYEASAVASSTVNISNATIPVTGTVNANITNASIPVSGSVAISSGTVSVSAGTVSVSSGNITAAVGATPTLLKTVTTNITAGGTTDIDPTSQLNNISIQKYSSVIFQIVYKQTGGGATAQTLTAGSYIHLSWSQQITTYDPTLPITGWATFTHPDIFNPVDGVVQTYQTSVTNAFINAGGIIKQTATGFRTGTITVNVFGSYESINTDQYVNFANPISATGYANPQVGVSYSDITTATATDVDLNTKNGNATITLATGSTTNTRSALELFWYDAGTAYFLTNLAMTAPGLTTLDYSLIENITLPAAPIHLVHRQTGLTPSSRLNITQ